MWKCAKCNAFTHSHIRAKIPPVGIENATVTYASREEVSRIGGGLAAISPGSPGYRGPIVGYLRGPLTVP